MICMFSDTLLLAEIFSYFLSMCFEKYGLDPGHFLSVPGLAWQAALKIAKTKLYL